MHKYLLIIYMLASATAFGGVNKWVDSNDQVHYSDQPPPANAKSSNRAKSKKQNSATDEEDSPGNASAAPASAPAAPKTVAEREADLKKAEKAKKEAADKVTKKQAEDDARKAGCEAAQQSLKTLESGVRLAEVDANGERSFVSDEQRQQRTAKAQEQVSKFCK